MKIKRKNAYKWKLRVNFEKAVELWANSESIIVFQQRQKCTVELTINFILCRRVISIYNSTALKKLTINFHEWA